MHNSHNCSKDIDAMPMRMHDARRRAQPGSPASPANQPANMRRRAQYNVRALGVHYNYSPTVSTAATAGGAMLCERSVHKHTITINNMESEFPRAFDTHTHAHAEAHERAPASAHTGRRPDRKLCSLYAQHMRSAYACSICVMGMPAQTLARTPVE